MPASMQASATGRTRRVPARCPSDRRRPLAAAQRPLPSMMMPTCRGTRRSRPFFAPSSGLSLIRRRPAISYFQNVPFLVSSHLRELLDHPVGYVLKLVGGPVGIVLGAKLLPLGFAEVLQGLAGGGSHRP